MPIYDYVCASCRHRLEVIHGINDAGPRFCPNCGEENTMRKALTSPAIHFKGSGWAKKDRSSTSATRAKSDGDSSTRDGTSSGADAASTKDGASTNDGAAAGKPGSSSSSSNDAPASTSDTTTASKD